MLQAKVKFLGSVVTAEGIEPDPDKIKAVVEWPQPTNLTELRAFTGLAGYYRRFIEGFARIAKPLSELTGKDVPFIWTPRQQEAFEALKKRLVEYPILAPPMEEGRFVVDTDASDYAMGAVLQQEQEGQVRVIAYASRTFQAGERNYCTTRKELAAVVFALKEFSHYLTGRKRFLLRTDHGALTSLFKAREPISQQARYLGLLASFNFDIQHRAGVLHGNSDGLSRRPCTDKKCTQPHHCDGKLEKVFQPHTVPAKVGSKPLKKKREKTPGRKTLRRFQEQLTRRIGEDNPEEKSKDAASKVDERKKRQQRNAAEEADIRALRKGKEYLRDRQELLQGVKRKPKTTSRNTAVVAQQPRNPEKPKVPP
jgi:hypothetical protein